MATLSDERIAALLAPYVPADSELSERVGNLIPKFGAYLDLLSRWNQRTNLTAVREPEEIVQRHFGESVFTANLLFGQVKEGGTLLDLGSGAGFPGLPIHLCLPELQVTLAESQGKKASFLREAVRTLGLKTEVWAARLEAMPPGRHFEFVTLRAVDRMEVAVGVAGSRVTSEGKLMVLGSSEAHIPEGWDRQGVFQVAFARQRYVLVLQRKPYVCRGVDGQTGR